MKISGTTGGFLCGLLCGMAAILETNGYRWPGIAVAIIAIVGMVWSDTAETRRLTESTADKEEENE